MTPDQRTRAEKELRDGARELARKQGEVQDDFNARRNEEMNRLQRTLFEEVRNYAKAQNFDLVIAESVIYSTPSRGHHAGDPATLQARASEAGCRRHRPARCAEACRRPLTARSRSHARRHVRHAWGLQFVSAVSCAAIPTCASIASRRSARPIPGRSPSSPIRSCVAQLAETRASVVVLDAAVRRGVVRSLR